MAASYQFKVGDVCIATIRESKDVSKKVVVKVQKILGEKCVVKPEDKDTPYYVQLNDLQPMHGEMNDYRSLPGYYHKSENDQEFHTQQKKRKNRRGRDEERKSNEFQNTSNKSRGGMHNNDSNRNRGRNNNNNRRVVSPTKPQTKENISPKKAEKQAPTEPSNSFDVVNSNAANNNGNEETVPKVAKHAETSAAFWGRMRSNPQPITPATTPESQEASDNIDTSKNYNDSNKQENINGPTKDSTVDVPVIKHKNNNKNSNDNSQLTEKVNKDANATNPFKGSNGKQAENLLSNDAQQKYILTTQASAKVNKVRENILMTSAKIQSNTTVQNSQPTTSNSKTTLLEKEPKIKPLNNQEKEAVSSPQNKNIQNVTEPKNLPKPKDQTPKNATPDLPPTTTTSNKSNSNEHVVKPVEASLTNKMEQMELNNKEVSNKTATAVVHEKSTTNNPKPATEKPGICLKTPKLGKIKKKVSFGATEFFEKEPQIPAIPSPMTSQAPETQTSPSVSTTGERGKIHIPKNHIEKHMNPTYQQSNNVQQHHQQYANSSDGVLTEQIHQQQQSVRIIPQQQSSYAHNPIANTVPTYYHQPAGAGMYPIVYRQDPNMEFRANNPYQLSQDPEAKDLPEGMLCIISFVIVV